MRYRNFKVPSWGKIRSSRYAVQLRFNSHVGINEFILLNKSIKISVLCQWIFLTRPGSHLVPFQ